jgi:hypothetical protein
VETLKKLPMFWWGLIAIVLAAALPRLLSYDYGLPYVEHPDEPNKYVAALAWRGEYEEPTEDYYAGYPPGYLAVSYAAQVIGEPLGVRGLAPTVRALRFVAVLVNLGTLAFIALAGRRMGGAVAGWVAGIAWGLSPLVVENGVYAIQDPFVYLWVALALWLAAVAATDATRKTWAFWSVLAGLVAVVFKYPVVSALLPGMAVTFAYALRDRQSRWLLGVEIALSIAMAAFVYRQIGLMALWQTEAGSAAASGLDNLLDPHRVANNLLQTFVPLNAPAALAFIALGAAAWALAARLDRERVDARVAGLALILIVTIPWLAASFSEVTVNRIKDVLPATAAACALLGGAAAQIFEIVPARWPGAARAGIVAALLLPVFAPQVGEVSDLVAERRLPDRRVALREWFDVNLDAGTVLVTLENEKTFNPLWGGLTGRKWFDWWRSPDIRDKPLDEWREVHQIAYAVVPLWQEEEIEQTPEGRALLGEMLRLREFSEPPPGRGPEVAVYRLRRMEHEVGVQFGEHIRLVGYDQDRGSAAPGEAVTFRFYWQASAPPGGNYSQFVHLVPEDSNNLLAQADGNPAAPERLTQTWINRDETLIGPPFVLNLPADLPSGTYRVLTGLYDFNTGVRLGVIEDITGETIGDAYEVTRIEVAE